MARITIEDLPVITELEQQEMEEIVGAGRFRPTMETLETRELMAASISANLDQGVLRIDGTDEADSVTVREADGRISVDNMQILVNQNGSEYSSVVASEVGEILFEGFGGDDFFNNQTTKPAVAHGGDGQDILVANGKLVLDGSAGDDSGYLWYKGSNEFNARLGEHNRVFTPFQRLTALEFRGHGGNDFFEKRTSYALDVTLDGGDGQDILVADGKLVLDGSAGMDVAKVSYDPTDGQTVLVDLNGTTHRFDAGSVTKIIFRGEGGDDQFINETNIECSNPDVQVYQKIKKSESPSFDGDGKADMALWRPSTGTWYIKTSSSDFNNHIEMQWGQQGDIVIPNSDFDGDGKADMALWRPSTGTWYIKTSSSDFNNHIEMQWGQQGDIVIPNSDFDGDGKADMALWRPSNGTWYIKTSSSNFNKQIQMQWGKEGDIPIRFNAKVALRPTLLVVVHGFQPGGRGSSKGGPESDTKGWIDFAETISNELRKGGSATVSLVVDWGSFGDNEQPSTNVTNEIKRFLSHQNQVWDVFLIGHSRGGIFVNEVARKLGRPNNLGQVMQVMLDPTAANQMGDEYPSHVPEGVQTRVYDDEFVLVGGVTDGVDIAGAENYNVQAEMRKTPPNLAEYSSWIDSVVSSADKGVKYATTWEQVSNNLSRASWAIQIARAGIEAIAYHTYITDWYLCKSPYFQRDLKDFLSQKSSALQDIPQWRSGWDEGNDITSTQTDFAWFNAGETQIAVKPVDLINSLLQYYRYTADVGITVSQNLVNGVLGVTRAVLLAPFRWNKSQVDQDAINNYFDHVQGMVDTGFSRIRAGNNEAYQELEDFLRDELAPRATQIFGPIEQGLTSLGEAIINDLNTASAKAKETKDHWEGVLTNPDTWNPTKWKL